MSQWDSSHIGRERRRTFSAQLGAYGAFGKSDIILCAKKIMCTWRKSMGQGKGSREM